MLDAEVFQDTAPEIPRYPLRSGSVKYSFESFCFNATSMGILASRHRRWSLWRRSGSMACGMHDVPFGEIFFRRLDCSFAVYLRAPADVLKDDVMTRAMQLMGLSREDLHPLGFAKAESVLPPGVLGRLRAWRAFAAERGVYQHSTKDTAHSSIIVDLNQNVEWAAMGLDVCLPLLRGAEPYDLVSDRPLHILERLLLHGFPAPGLADETFAKHFPFPSLLRDGGLTPGQLKSLTGNGMVLQVAGAVLLYLLSGGGGSGTAAPTSCSE